MNFYSKNEKILMPFFKNENNFVRNDGHMTVLIDKGFKDFFQIKCCE